MVSNLFFSSNYLINSNLFYDELTCRRAVWVQSTDENTASDFKFKKKTVRPRVFFCQSAVSKMVFFYILGYWNQPQIHQVWWCRYRRVDPFQAHVRGSLLRIPPSRTFRRQVNIYLLFLDPAMFCSFYLRAILNPSLMVSYLLLCKIF